MKIGIDSSWSAGVLSAAILLTANSYRRTAVTPMPMRRLARWLVFIIFGAFFGGLIGGILGHACLLNGVSKDFGDLGEFGISQPARFMTTWGIHAGSYFGAAVFTVIAASLIRYGNSSAIMLPDVGTPNGD
jgi:energy-coupling factor transporter transmembrane protein EcfT